MATADVLPVRGAAQSAKRPCEFPVTAARRCWLACLLQMGAKPPHRDSPLPTLCRCLPVRASPSCASSEGLAVLRHWEVETGTSHEHEGITSGHKSDPLTLAISQTLLLWP